ncbi:SagB/ThcOx family dehydrogenase [candidate division WOR-3 bacterium]|nr:SagB/ThcOx family dehydrogenase [candidate division WOR-3 bacterium]
MSCSEGLSPFSPPSARAVKLPPPACAGTLSVDQALAERRSVRRYADDPLTLAEVSQLLWAAYGITQPLPGIPELGGGFRAAPSAGALYPLELYLVAGAVTGLEPGIYRYRPGPHDLLDVLAGDRRQWLCHAALGQTMVQDAPASLVYSAVFSRNTAKYGERGRRRYVCMDLGHSAENVYLQCASLGLGTCGIAAFHDDAVRLVTRLPENEEPLYIMPVGRLPQKKGARG